MVLKDASGYVRLYALVNVEHPSIVATAPNQAEAMKAYKELLVENEIVEGEKLPETELLSTEITVKDIKTFTVDGNTVIYFVDDNGVYYKGMLRDLEQMIFVEIGDMLHIEYSKTDDEKIKLIESLVEIFEE